MRKILISILFLIFSTITSYADQFYAGIDIAQISLDTGVSNISANLDEDDTLMKFTGGYNVNENVSIEAFYLDFGQASLSGVSGNRFSYKGSTYQFIATGTIYLTADVAGVGIMSDYDLCEHFEGNVIDMNKMKKEYPQYDYNTFQLKLFSSAEGFVTTNGGGGILCSYFQKPVVMYIPHGKELRTNYVTNKDSYLNKLSENNIYPVIDEGNMNNYSKVIEKIKKVFKD